MHTLWMVRHTVHRDGDLNPTGLTRTPVVEPGAKRTRSHAPGLPTKRSPLPRDVPKQRISSNGHAHHPRQMSQTLKGAQPTCPARPHKEGYTAHAKQEQDTPEHNQRPRGVGDLQSFVRGRREIV